MQLWLPLNPQKMATCRQALAFNTAVSFTTNTNWQNYGGESTMSYFTQMAGLAYHNFASAATGIVLAIVIIRGIARKETDKLGNFWVDMTRCMLWVLLPICLVGSLVLVSQGVIQNLKPYTTAKLTEPQTVQVTGVDGKTTTQTVTRAGDRRKGRWRRKKSSRSWAPTAAASSTPIAPTRLRTPRLSRISLRWC